MVPVKTALFFFGENSSWWANEYVVTRSSAHVVDVTPVVVVVHELLWFLIARELGRELARDIVAVEHERAVSLGLGTQDGAWRCAVRVVDHGELIVRQVVAFAFHLVKD